MYDILQLNDMLVPELLDIAEQLKITNSKKLDKQELVYKILDKQAIADAAAKNGDDGKPKRKRIVKTTTANSTEEAEVMQEKPRPEPKPVHKTEHKPEPKHPVKKAEPVAEKPVFDKKKPQVKKVEQPIEFEEELQPITDDQITIPAAIASLLQQEDEVQQQQPDLPSLESLQQPQPAKQFQQRREQPVFNIEFDGITLGACA